MPKKRGKKKTEKAGMIVSMFYTTPAVVAKRKSETRRARWTDKYAQRFRVGEIGQAYSKRPDLNGEKVALIKTKVAPFREKMGVHCEYAKAMRLYENEGFAYLDSEEDGYPLVDVLMAWIESNEETCVLKFDVVEVMNGMERKYCNPSKIAHSREMLLKYISDRTDQTGEAVEDEDAPPKSDVETVTDDMKKELADKEMHVCDWCKKEVPKVEPMEQGGDKFNICQKCQELVDNGDWGQVAEKMGHIPEGSGKAVDELKDVNGDEIWTCNGCGTVHSIAESKCASCGMTNEESDAEIEENNDDDEA